MHHDLVDSIYEAAFVPDLWPAALQKIAEDTHSVSGAILVFGSPHQPPRFRATKITRAALEEFCTGDLWRNNHRAMINPSDVPPTFLNAKDYLTPEQLEIDSVQKMMTALELGEQAGTMIALPTGDVVTFAFERRAVDGRHTPVEFADLNRLRPHLARAGLIAARLGLERALGTVAAMDAMGLPAAVLSANGRVLATNALFERLPMVFIARAHGGLALATEPANALLQAALAETARQPRQAVRSIPIAGTEDRPAVVVHALPLRRAAHDVFSGGDMLIVATMVGATGMAPSPHILNGLFDLTLAEARLAAALTEGKSLKQAAAEHGIQVSTARSYLEQIFRKTGTHQQSQLVALLKTAQPLVDASR